MLTILSNRLQGRSGIKYSVSKGVSSTYARDKGYASIIEKLFNYNN